MQKLISILLIFILSSCLPQNQTSRFYGFWEGPHPEDSRRKFYIQIENKNDTLTTKGYWTENSFYQAQFEVENLSMIDDSLSFKIPGWKCTYRGHLLKNDLINGGFRCEGEPFDSVFLVKNEKIMDYLIFPKPGCKKPDFQYKYTVPLDLNDQIETSSFYSTNDSVYIFSLVNEIINGAYGRLNSFLLYKNNHLICEEYFYGYSKQDLHQIESSTKSLTSLLIGIAKDKNLITNLNEHLFEIFPEYPHLKTLKYKDIKVNHLLSMTSGFDPQNDLLFQSDNRIDFSLKRKMIDKPGATFRYDGGNTEILGAILHKKTGMFADEFAKKYLFDPLHIGRYNWEIVKQNGFPSTSGSLHLLPRDMLKIGVMVLNNGSFNQRQIVSDQWIRESTAVKTKTHIPDDDYSYQWWNLKLESNGKTYKTIWANGWGSQFIYIFPEINAVMVTTGHNYEFDSWAITDGIRKYLYLLNSK
ncbi:beta-lactamase family protein [Draconibacterium sp.]|nr:beta-lactamase family protein [Draconibacterium sp.]